MPGKGKPDPNSLIVRGIEIPVRTEFLEQRKLVFFTENPRIYAIMRTGGKEPTQTEIQQQLLEMDHVKQLIQDIRSNQGLIDPIIVREGSGEVLEGNSRLAAYRALAKNDPVKWGLIKCVVLPADIEESLVFALLGQYHIKGKKDWAPYEQAGFLYRRFKAHKLDAKTLADEIGMTQHKVKHLIETYEFMLEHEENDTSRWSYYDEYLKSSKIKKARKRFPDFDELIVRKIQSEEIERAVDVRDRLPVICSLGGKTLTKFAAGETDFDEAYESAVAAGGDSVHYKRLAKFRQWLAKSELDKILGKTKGQTRERILFELGKLAARIKGLREKLG